MRGLTAYSAALCAAVIATASWAEDVYDWRARMEGLCAQSFKFLDRPIQNAMTGGRPEKLVVEKIASLREVIPTIQSLGYVDETTARIIVQSLVHSYFTDKRLLDPLNFSVESYRQVYRNCRDAVVRYASYVCPVYEESYERTY